MFDAEVTGPLSTYDGPFKGLSDHQGAFAILERRYGDLKIIWDANNAEEVAAARDTFEKLTKGKKKHLAFAVKPGTEGETGDQIREFDPNLRRMVFTPQVVGG